MLDVAVIGTGYFSQFHYRAWQRLDDVRIVALHAQDESTGQTIAEHYDISSVYTNIDSLLEQASPALVDIVTPPPSHTAIIKRCIDLGIPCICQKPFCNDLLEARSLVETIVAARAMVVVHENFRFQPWYREIHRLLSTGLIGELYEVQFNLRPGDGQGPSAYLERQPYFQQQKRFLIQETGVHFIDVFRYLFGDISGLFARLSTLNPVIAGEDAGIVIIEFCNGMRGTFNGNRLVDHASDNPRRTMGEMVIEGSAGTLSLDGYGIIRCRLLGETESVVCEYSFDDVEFGGDCVYRTNRHVVDHLLKGSTLENEAVDYLVNREIEEAVYTSHDKGSWVSFKEVFL